VLPAEAVVRADDPAADVEDRVVNFCIATLQPHVVVPKVYVQLETSHKVIGWGEISALEPRRANSLVNSLFELLDGENPTRIEFLWQELYRAHRDIRGGLLMLDVVFAPDN
jgi:galactonate dehydratase